jgi:hypothetical protein
MDSEMEISARERRVQARVERDRTKNKCVGCKLGSRAKDVGTAVRNDKNEGMKE